MAVQDWGGDTPPTLPEGSCAALGNLPAVKCEAANSSKLKCDYTGGDDSRQVSFIYTCGVQMTPPTASQPPGGNAYVIEFVGPAACAAAGGGAKGMSWGTLTLILLPVAATLYLGGGVCCSRETLGRGVGILGARALMVHPPRSACRPPAARLPPASAQACPRVSCVGHLGPISVPRALGLCW